MTELNQHINSENLCSLGVPLSAESNCEPLNKEQLNPFAPPPSEPVLFDRCGVRFDFNDGARIFVPEGKWRVEIKDLFSDNILFSSEVDGPSWILSSRKYFVRFGIAVRDLVQDKEVVNHSLSLSGQEVLVQFPVGTLGDSIAWFSYLEAFKNLHNCKLYCVMSDLISPLFIESYPDIVFLNRDKVDSLKPYATYNIGLFFRGDTDNKQPSDFRLVGLHKTAAYILGVPPEPEVPPRVRSFKQRPIKEKYVCIAAQSSSQAKYWNNPTGWADVVLHLKSRGYRVLCIDKEKTHGTGLVWNHIPFGAEDFTGNIPLIERAKLLQHADFFIGLSSGLSWLAWACKTPVVMISGVTHPINEFQTKYRVWNTHVCNSCWNDMNIIFDHFNFLWCPRHEGTARQFECTRAITSSYVIRCIDRCIDDLAKSE
jgi:autotransporter strand-loop-strand O-heptosyltransferase